MPKKIRDLTPHEAECARRLKAIYNQKKGASNLNQSKLGETLGMSQSAVGQYINGKIPLNLKATIAFADALECEVSDIDPQAPDTRRLTDDELRIAQAYRRSTRAGKDTLLRVAEMSASYEKEHTEPDQSPTK